MRFYILLYGAARLRKEGIHRETQLERAADHFTPAPGALLDLTPEEQAFVAAQDTLRVGYVQDRVPVSFQGKDGSFQGITRYIIDRVARLSGLSLRERFPAFRPRSFFRQNLPLFLRYRAIPYGPHAPFRRPIPHNRRR